MPYKVAGIDVHKKVLMVVITDVEPMEWQFERARFGTGWGELKKLHAWLGERGVQEAVMESTAQYWKPVWLELEGTMRLHLAQAQSNRAPGGRKSDWRDAQRLLQRFVAGELFLSFVPEAEQRSWRSLTRARVQLVRERVQLQNQIESLLEEGRIKLSSVISDVLGASGWRILQALAKGESTQEQLAALGDERLKCGRAVLADALTGSLSEIHRTLLRQHLDRITLINHQREELSRCMADKMAPYQAAILRLIEVPGIGVEAAHQILAEIGPQAAAFPSARQLASWMGVCPGSQESAEQNQSGKCAKGNRFLRRVLCQAAQAAVHKRDSYLQSLFRRLIVRLGYVKAIWAIAHRLCLILWHILHQGDTFIEYGRAVKPQAIARAIKHHLKALKALGYMIPEQPAPQPFCG